MARRIRKVVIAVSENFYNVVDKERKKLDMSNRKLGVSKPTSWISITDCLAKQMSQGNFNIQRRINEQKRRRF